MLPVRLRPEGDAVLSPEEIASRQFLISLRGYDRDEVTNFLREVAQQHARLQERLRQLEEQVAAVRAEGRGASYGGGEAGGPASPREAFQALGEETTRILVAAEESAEEIRRRATERARNELEQARREAREEVDGARRTANKVVADAERRRDDIAEEVRKLEGARDRYMQDLRGAVQAVQSAVRDLAPPEEADGDADPVRRAVAPAGPPQEGDELVADHEHVAPEGATAGALEDDEVAPVGAAVAASASTDEEDVDEALATGPPTARAEEAPEPEEDDRPEAAAGQEPKPELETETEPAEPATQEATDPDPADVLPDQPVAEEPPRLDPIALRTEALADVRPQMLRRLKRALQDVQNGVLDAIRRHSDEGGDVDVLLPRDEDLAAMGDVGGVFLGAAYQAGVADGAGMVDADPTALEGNGSRVPATSATFQAVLAHEISSSLSATLRAGLEAGEPETSLSERVGEVFRDLKGPVIESVADEQLVRVYGYGVLDSWEELGASSIKSWVVGEEPRCPANQCRTNANEESVGLREAFPSGEQVPPAHDACTCAVAPGPSQV